MLWPLLAQPAWPCAGIFHGSEVLAESDTQEVILRQLDEGVEVSYRVEYAGDAADFGWVIPIFGDLISIEDGDESDFDDLHDSTAPVVERLYAAEESSGCSRTKSDNALSGSDTASSGWAGVVAEGFTGTYDYVVLDAKSADALTDWLAESGWSITTAQAAVEAYIAEGSVQFLALHISGTAPTDAALLPPITIQTTGSQLRFPATMAAEGMVETQRTTIYVLGDQRASISGWASTEGGIITGGIGEDPQALFAEALWEAGGEEPGYFVTYAGYHSSRFSETWVTRMDTLAAKEAHTTDPIFSLSGGTSGVQTTIRLEETTSEGWLLLPLLGGLGLWRRRRVTGA